MVWERSRRYVHRPPHAVNIFDLRIQLLSTLFGDARTIVHGSSIIDRLAIFRHTQDTLGLAGRAGAHYLYKLACGGGVLPFDDAGTRATYSGTSQVSLYWRVPMPVQH